MKIKRCRIHRYMPDPPHDGWISYTTKKGNIVYECKYCDEYIDLTIKRIKEELKQKNLELDKKVKEELWDSYVISQLLKGIKNKNKIKIEKIPKDLIELKRANLRLEKLIKEKKNPKPLMICKKHGDLFLNNVIKSRISSGIQKYRCKLCMKNFRKNYYNNNKEYVLKKCLEYRKKNPEKVKSFKSKYWRTKNGKNNQHEAT